MTVKTIVYQLAWYVNRLKRGEPFSSLLYGDGELLVAAGQRQGQLFTGYKELVTPALRDELLASLDDSDPSIIRGTDLNLINYVDYKGGDWAGFRETGQAVEGVIARNPSAWVDGTIWETAAERGELAPLLNILWEYSVVLIGNRDVFNVRAVRDRLNSFIDVPAANAAAGLGWIEKNVIADNSYGYELYLVCTGLGAIPLIMRLRRRFPKATFLDLGSTFDIFVYGKGHRGWQQREYADRTSWERLVIKNLGEAD